MALITQEEVRKVARLSHIEITDQEIAGMVSHLEAVLTYAARVQDIAKDIDVALMKNSNVEREDVVIPTDPEPIRAQAPEREGDYFVVPVIIEAS
jgi:aspartyl-tRNA(Asn)/glutamyl-tRNA(Gln) amidotransferase subunit C